MSRQRGLNVIDVSYNKNEIKDAITKQINHGHYKQDSIYGNGSSSLKIVKILENFDISSQKNKLLVKYNMNFIAIIPARGGSKGIPNKNLIEVNSKPLISFTIEESLKSRYLKRIIVSTDDKNINNLALSSGIEVPFRRPKNISLDSTPMIDVLKHAVKWINAKNISYKALVLLQPTSPLRKANHIDEAIELFLSKRNVSSVVSVVKIPHQFSPISALKLNGGILQSYENNKITYNLRQNKPTFYARNGPAILIISKKTIENNELYGKKSLPYIMPKSNSLDIDDYEDLNEFKKILDLK